MSSIASPALGEFGPTPDDLLIPWPRVSLGDLFEIQQGKALNSRTNGSGPRKPFLRTANILWIRIDLSHVDEMPFSPEEMKRLQLSSGDLLVCEGGDIGRTAIWRGELSECAHQNHVHRLRARRPDVLSEFFAFWMQAAIQLLGLYGGEGNKTTIPNLSKARLERFQVPLPPLPVQRRIARVLNAIQRAIEAQAKVIAAAHELKRSLMRHLLTYGPVPVSEAARISLKETEIGPVPEHWSIQRISALCTHIVDCPHSTPTWTEAGALAIRNVNIKDGQLVPPRYFVSQDEYAARIRRLEPRPGDVLLSREAPIGEACLVPSRTQLCLGQRIMLMRTNGRLLVNSFLVYSFYSPRIRSLLESIGKGVTAKHINVADVKDLRIAIPPQTEQLRIVAVLLATDAKLSHEVERQQALSALFSSALHHLMTGKLRVPESLEA